MSKVMCSVVLLAGVAACHKTVVVQEQAPVPVAPQVSPDSVLALCTRGDTTVLQLRNRNTGIVRNERWLLTGQGSVVDVTSGRLVMDSAEVSRVKYRDILAQQRQTGGIACS